MTDFDLVDEGIVIGANGNRYFSLARLNRELARLGNRATIETLTNALLAASYNAEDRRAA